METVELIRYRKGMYEYFWSLEERYTGDELWEIERKAFAIPEGFSVGEYGTGKLGFFDKDGIYCELYTNRKTNQPYFITLEGHICLKPADLVFSSVKDLRRAVGFTQKEFAEYFGIPKRTLEKWETGETEPTDYLVKLMEYKLRAEGVLTSEVKENQE